MFRNQVGPLLGSGILAFLSIGCLFGVARADECTIDYSWHHKSALLDAGPFGEVVIPASDPIALWAQGTDRHILVHECTGCDNSRIKHEFRAKVRYEWTITQGGGHFTRVANTTDPGPDDSQQILYHPPALEDDEQVEVEIWVLMYHDDPIKDGPHAPAAVAFDMVITRDHGFDTFAYEGIPVRIEKPENTFEITLTHYDIDPSLGITDDPADSCEPLRDDFDSTPIVASFTPATSDILTKDIILFEAQATDEDIMEIYCSATAPCSSNDSQVFYLDDDLHYSWQVDRGMFLYGGAGREVVYVAPEEPGPITVQLTVTDTGTRYVDEPCIVTQTFDVSADLRRIRVAGVGWIQADTLEIPAATEVPPAAPGAGKFKLAPVVYKHLYRWAAKFSPRGVLRPIPSRPLFKYDGSWVLSVQYPVLGGVPITTIHPWLPGIMGIRMAANDPPPAQFASLPGMRTWLDQRGFRAAVALELEAMVRRDVIICIEEPGSERFDYISDTGYTLMNMADQAGEHFLDPRMPILRRLGDHWEKGVTEGRSLEITGLCSNRVDATMVHVFRASNNGSKINVLMTNRFLPTIHAEFMASVFADRPSAPSDFTSTANPQFPTWDLYFGRDADPMQRDSTTPNGPILDFLNLGEKWDRYGL